MPKTVHEGFTTFLTRITPTQSERDAAARHRAGVKGALEARLTVSRFFETGSFSHGTGIRHHSDVDALVSIGGGTPESADTALRWVKDALSVRYPSTIVKVRRPAVVVEFASRAETWEVIPGFLTSRGDSNTLVYDIPGPATGWIDTAPDQHLRYVNESNKVPKSGCAKSLARLMKAWKYYCNVPVSSFYLEMRAAQYVRGLKTYVHVWDLCGLLESLRDHGLAAMNDPSYASGRIHPCSSDAKKRDALSKLDTAATRARKGLEAHKAERPADAFYYLNLLFGGHFPAR